MQRNVTINERYPEVSHAEKPRSDLRVFPDDVSGFFDGYLSFPQSYRDLICGLWSNNSDLSVIQLDQADPECISHESCDISNA